MCFRITWQFGLYLIWTNPCNRSNESWRGTLTTKRKQRTKRGWNQLKPVETHDLVVPKKISTGCPLLCTRQPGGVLVSLGSTCRCSRGTLAGRFQHFWPRTWWVSPVLQKNISLPVIGTKSELPALSLRSNRKLLWSIIYYVYIYIYICNIIYTILYIQYYIIQYST